MRHFVQFLLYLLVMLFVISNLSATAAEQQEDRKSERKSRDRYLGVGPFFSYVNVIDHATSPLFYKGFNLPGASIGYLVHSENKIWTFETDFSYGNLRSDTETPWYNPVNSDFLLVMRLNKLYRLNKLSSGTPNYYVGPEINVNGHFRVNYKYGNSALTFDSYTGAGIAARVELPFSWKARGMKLWFLKINKRDRDLRLNWQLSSPIASFLVRPTFVTITNFIDPELQRKITSENTGGGFFVPLNIRSQTELCYVLYNNNMIRFTYLWNFYNHDPGTNKVQSAWHGFMFSLMFRFNNNSL